MGKSNRNLSGGQFRELFHATEVDNVPHIKAEGLHGDDDPGNYTVSSKADAKDYAEAAMDDERYALLHIRLPTAQADHYLHPGLQGDGGTMHGLRRTIPPEYIHKVTKHRIEW